MELFSTAILLFLIMDPLGNVPIFLSVLKNVNPARRRKIIIRELLIALFIMALFLFSGRSVLNILGLTREAVAIAGAIILFIISIKMIFPPQNNNTAEDIETEEPLIVPLAIPLIAGPSLLATLILLTESSPTHFWQNFFATFLAWAASASILTSAPFLYRVLGNRGLKAAERLMGMILVSLSVQMFLNALKTLF